MLALYHQQEELNQGKRNHRPCFELLSGGTGAWSQTIRILKKLYENGYDLLADPELEKIFVYENIKNETINEIPIIYEKLKN